MTSHTVACARIWVYAYMCNSFHQPGQGAPCHDRLKALGAVFGQKFGWERANWFAPEGVEPVDDWSFRRSRWFEHVGRECRNVAANVGLLDMTAFAKCRVSGPGAESFLDRLVANRVPARSGPVRLVHALNTRGGVHSEFTLWREGEGSFYLVSASAFQRLDFDPRARLPGAGCPSDPATDPRPAVRLPLR